MKKISPSAVLIFAALLFLAAGGKLYAQQTRTFRSGNRIFHITPEGDTIVSSLNGPNGKFFERLNKEAQANSATDSVPSDPLNPIYGLNSYIPAHDFNYATTLNFYGSGDVNNDGKLNMKDYNAIVYSTRPYYDGTYREDVNLDGVVNAQDKTIILKAIKEGKKGLNVWELETPAQKLEHFKKALAIDPTDKVNPYETGWSCSYYSTQLYIDFNGIFNIKKASHIAGDNGTNQQFDLFHNGIFRIPLRNVSTWTSDGIAHAINVVYIGGPEHQDAGKFDYWVFVEPQTDKIQKVGDYSLARNAQIFWYGYFYNYFGRWGYGAGDFLNYTLNSDGTVTRTYMYKNLVLSWNPMEKVKYPLDKVLEYPADTSAQANGSPSNLYGIWAEVSHSDSSTQTHDGAASEVNYNVFRTWNITEGAYNPSNTPDATHEQVIRVEDTIPPTYDKGKNGPVNVKDNSNLPVTVTIDTVSTQGSDTTQCSYYTYTKEVKYTMTDISGNASSYEDTLENVVDKPPYIISLPVPNNDTIFVKTGRSISPDTLGWAQWKDPEGGPVTRHYADTLLAQTTLYVIWHRVETAGDPCEVSPDTAAYFIYRGSPEGIAETAAAAKAVIFPNPATGSFTLRYSTLRGQELTVVLYNLQGQALQEKHRRVPAGKNQIPFTLTTPGMYFIKIEDANGHVEVVRFMVKR